MAPHSPTCMVCGESYATPASLSRHQKWAKSCAGKVSPQTVRQPALVRETAVGEKVTLVDVTEGAIFVEIGEQEEVEGDNNKDIKETTIQKDKETLKHKDITTLNL